jgi:serine/threonine protein phosphatase PrpC
MQEIHSTCQGESHKATNKVCQDYSYVEITNDLTIAVVCDGHGGERYFRSDIGSKVAAEVTAECMRLFIEGIDKNILLFSQIDIFNFSKLVPDNLLYISYSILGIFIPF